MTDRARRRSGPSLPPRPTARVRPPADPPRALGRHRFLAWDEYRVEREWRRYEGTPLRDLYRQLRERFLVRHRPPAPGWSLEIGPGPGRFSHLVGHPDDRVTVLELSRAMLERIPVETSARGLRRLDRVQGDAVDMPFRPARFHQVALLGNVLGFAEEDAFRLLDRTVALVAPGGTLLLEFSPGGGERSRYLHRLPSGAIARLFAAPLRAVLPRVEREGFDRVRGRDSEGRRFRRFSADLVRSTLHRAGLRTEEVVAVAPCLGNDPARLPKVRAAGAAWARLLDLEETVGRSSARLADAAAVLLAARRPEVAAEPANDKD